MPMTMPVLSVTTSWASTVFVKRISIPMWISAMRGSLPVLFMFGTVAICTETSASCVWLVGVKKRLGKALAWDGTVR